MLLNKELIIINFNISNYLNILLLILILLILIKTLNRSSLNITLTSITN